MKVLRVKGHKLTMEWSREYGVESSSTGSCPCGWEESASNQTEVRHEYRQHLLKVMARNESSRTGLDYWKILEQITDAFYKRKPFVPYPNDCGTCHGKPLDEVALCRDCNGTGEHQP